MALCIGADGAVERSYFEPGPIVVERDGEPVQLYTRGIGEVFTELGRAGFRVDTIARAPARHAPARASRRPSCGAPARKAPDHSVARCAAGYLRRGHSLPGERLRCASPPHHSGQPVAMPCSRAQASRRA